MSFLYRGGKLPFCLGRFPYFSINNAVTVPYGEGTQYPLELTIEQYAACFWKVKTWEFSGYIDCLIDIGSSTYNFDTNFSFTFTRNVSEEKYLICKNNRQTQGIWPELPNEGILEFTGTRTRPSGTDTINLELSCDFGYRQQSDQYFDVTLRSDGMLQCYFAFEITVEASTLEGDPLGTIVILTNDETVPPPQTSPPYAGSLQMYLPNINPIDISVFGSVGDGGISEFKIEPIEFFTWGGLYNPANGAPV